MRYEDSIQFIIDVPNEIMDLQIPKLVLQPIVENSIQHGIFERESKSGEIVIMAWMEAILVKGAILPFTTPISVFS